MEHGLIKNSNTAPESDENTYRAFGFSVVGLKGCDSLTL